MALSPGKQYSDKEEALNIWSHAFGIVLSSIGTFLLLLKTSSLDEIVCCTIYGASLILLYTASTWYHSAKDPVKRAHLRIFDHIAIYFLIAGTYTPFSWITLKNSVGVTVLIIIWACALAGLVLKLFFTGRFQFLSVAIYIGMGWIGVFAAGPLMEQLHATGVWLILAGGVSYTVGAILYAIKRIPYNHAIFHVFVLLGSFLHFLSIYWYVV